MTAIRIQIRIPVPATRMVAAVMHHLITARLHRRKAAPRMDNSINHNGQSHGHPRLRSHTISMCGRMESRLYVRRRSRMCTAIETAKMRPCIYVARNMGASRCVLLYLSSCRLVVVKTLFALSSHRRRPSSHSVRPSRRYSALPSASSLISQRCH